MPFGYEFAFALTVGDEDWIAYQLAHCPPWLRREWGERLESLLGGLKGEAAELAKQAVKARFVAGAPDDAVPHLGADTVILRAPSETTAAYRARVGDAFATWATQGTEAGLLSLLSVAGITAVLVEDQDVGGILGHWARWYLYVLEPNPFTATTAWGSFTWGGGATWGIGSTALTQYVQNVVRLWKPAHTRCLGVTVQVAGTPTPFTIPIDDDLGVGAPLPDSITDATSNSIVSADGERILNADAV